jgi:branched-chain amino acid aminotransferase
VRSVDRRQLNGGRPGEITRNLQRIYFDVVMGRVDEYRHWCTEVTPE